MIQVPVGEVESSKYHSKTSSFKLKKLTQNINKKESYELKPGHNELKVFLSSKDVLNLY